MNFIVAAPSFATNGNPFSKIGADRATGPAKLEKAKNESALSIRGLWVETVWVGLCRNITSLLQ